MIISKRQAACSEAGSSKPLAYKICSIAPLIGVSDGTEIRLCFAFTRTPRLQAVLLGLSPTTGWFPNTAAALLKETVRTFGVACEPLLFRDAITRISH
jgi:hypothetical protein